MGEKTHEEVFTKKKHAVDHMRIFGTPVYVHVPKEKRAKLEPSGKKGIFVGYSDCSKAYRVYIPGQRYIEVNRDVIFHEEAVFRKTLEISLEDVDVHLSFQIQKFTGRMSLMIKLQMFLRTLEVH